MALLCNNGLNCQLYYIESDPKSVLVDTLVSQNAPRRLVSSHNRFWLQRDGQPSCLPRRFRIHINNAFVRPIKPSSSNSLCQEVLRVTHTIKYNPIQSQHTAPATGSSKKYDGCSECNHQGKKRLSSANILI